MVDTRRTLSSLQTLLADNTAGDISPQDARDFLVSAYPDMENVRNYGAKADGTTDDTSSIQDAIDAAGSSGAGGGTVFIPAGIYIINQLTIPTGVNIMGEGQGSENQGGTILEQKDGVNQSAIVTSISPATAFWHHVKFSNFRLFKVSGATDTIGHGIDVLVRTGEWFTIEKCLIRDFPQSGIAFARGGTTLKIRDASFFSNGEYGIDIVRTGGDTWQTVALDGISGDNNTNALIRVKTLGDTRENISITNVKAETTTAGKQLYVIELDGTNQAPIYLSNISALGTGVTGTAVIRIENASARIIGTSIRSNGFTDLIDDNQDNVNVTVEAGRTFFYYEKGVMLFELHDQMRTESFFDIKEMTAPAAPPANECRIYAVDNAGKTELVVRFPTGAVQQIAIEP